MSEQWYDWLVVFEKVKSIVSKVMPRHIATIWRGFIIIINFFSFSQYRIEVAVCIHGSEPTKNVKYVKFHPFGAPKNPLCHFSTVQDVSYWLSTFKIFSGCKVTSVTIPNSVTEIGNFAFNCKNLATVVSLIDRLFKIPDGTFSKTTFMNGTLYVPSETMEEYKATEGWKNFVYIEERVPNGVANIRAREEIIKSEAGQLTVEDVDSGTQVSVYAINGKHIGSAVSQNGRAVIRTNQEAGSVVILKIGNRSVRVIVK